MKDFNTKIDDTAGAQGQVDASEYNSLFDEVKNTITVFGTALAEGDSKQMQKAMDIATKAINYEDGGTANTVQLTRPITSETTEQLFDGMVVFFTPKFANTGATTLKITTLTAKPAKYLGADLTADFLKSDYCYKAVFDEANDWFELNIVANKKYLEDFGFAVASTAEAQAGIDNIKGITPLRLHETIMGGVLQNWQDMSSSRMIGVTYVNTTGRPIMVKVSLDLNAGQFFVAVVDGVSLDRETNSSSEVRKTTFVVPNGSSYAVSVSAGTIFAWAELR